MWNIDKNGVYSKPTTSLTVGFEKPAPKIQIQAGTRETNRGDNSFKAKVSIAQRNGGEQNQSYERNPWRAELEERHILSRKKLIQTQIMGKSLAIVSVYDSHCSSRGKWTSNCSSNAHRHHQSPNKLHNLSNWRIIALNVHDEPNTAGYSASSTWSSALKRWIGYLPGNYGINPLKGMI